MAKPLKTVEAVSKLTELESYATEVFGERDAALKWFGTPLWELKNLSPRQWIAHTGGDGVQDVRDVLLRIEYGVYS
jgi:uncharacterized protein (DUF2384 family)